MSVYITVITRHPEDVADYLGFGARVIERGRTRFDDHALIVECQEIEGRDTMHDARWNEQRLGSGMHGARITDDVDAWKAENGYQADGPTAADVAINGGRIVEEQGN